MFGMDVLKYKPQIDPIVLDFPIFPALGNGGAGLNMSTLGPEIGEN